MALRVRSRAPQDENAALPHLSGKVMQGNAGMPTLGKSGGLKQQQVSNPERKKLSNITNTLKPNGATSKPTLKLSDSENPSSKLLPSSGSLKKPSARVPLRNITNENAVAGPSPSNAPAKELKQTKAKAKIAGPKSEGPNTEEQKPWAKYDQPLADPELEKLVQEWAKEGIERNAGATGDEQEALRLKQEDEEIQARVAAVMAHRMEFPSFLHHSNEPYVELKEVLDMDPSEKFDADGISITPFPELDWRTPNILADDESLKYSCSAEDIPSIPENWHLVKNLPAQKPAPKIPASKIWL